MLVRFTSDGSNVRDGFTATATCLGSQCSDAMRAACGHESNTGCIMCAGTHAGELRDAGCSNDAIQDWCENNVIGYNKAAASVAYMARAPDIWSGTGTPAVAGGITVETAKSICSDDIAGSKCWGFDYVAANNTAFFKQVISDSGVDAAYVSNRTHAEASGIYSVQRAVMFSTTVLQTLPYTPSALCAATCDKLTVGTGAIKVGSRVQVKDTVSEPVCSWGSVSHGDCGTVTSLTGSSTKCPVFIDFDSQKDWHGVTSELEPCGGGCSLFVMRGTTCELRGWTSADGVDVYIKTRNL